MEQTFELNDIYVQGAKFPAFLFFKTFGQPQNGMLEAYAELFTPFNNEKNEKTIWWNGNTQLPETALIPVILKDVDTINKILSAFQFGGIWQAFNFHLKQLRKNENIFNGLIPIHISHRAFLYNPTFRRVLHTTSIQWAWRVFEAVCFFYRPNGQCYRRAFLSGLTCSKRSAFTFDAVVGKSRQNDFLRACKMRSIPYSSRSHLIPYLGNG